MQAMRNCWLVVPANTSLSTKAKTCLKRVYNLCSAHLYSHAIMSQHAHHAPKVHLCAHTVDHHIKLTHTLLEGGIELLEPACSKHSHSCAAGIITVQLLPACM